MAKTGSSKGAAAGSDDPRRERALEAILGAAAEAIAERGFHGMSMRELAKATGRSLGGLYTYFGSKEELLFALNVRAFDVLVSTARHALVAAGGDAIAELRAFIANHVSYFVHHGGVMRVLIHETSALEPGERREVRAVKQRYFELGRGVVARILEAERGAPVDEGEVERATYSIFGMMNWVYTWYEPRRHGGAAALVDTIARMAVGGLVGDELGEGGRPRGLSASELPSPVRRLDGEPGEGEAA